MSLSKLKCPRFHPHLMPVQLQAVVQPRLASTASMAHYPYPSHRHPKPHEIFHLPLSASQAEIKSRYIDLVRAHHPDSAHCSHLPPTERHARFQAISAAYDHLRGKSTSFPMVSSYDDQLHEDVRRRARRGHNRTAEFEDRQPEADRAADIVPIIFGGLLIFIAVLPGLASAPGASSRSASLNLAEARREAQIYGQERRKEILRQARKYELAKEEERHRNQSMIPGRWEERE